MNIDLTALFNGNVSQMELAATVSMDDLIYSTYTPIQDGVAVQGRLYTKADVLYLELDISFVFSGYCDRCAAALTKPFSLTVKRIVVEQLQNENDDDAYIVVSNRVLDLDALVREEVALSLPSKILCAEDCKGLCPQCGANLNEETCDCKGEVDPRMAALLQLLEEE